MSGFQASFIHKNCSGQLLSAYFLFFFFFLEILNFNLTFAVNATVNLLVDVTNVTLNQFLKESFQVPCGMVGK